jgi:hypothetical protein
MVADDALLQRRADPLTAELDGETVMLDPTKGSYFALGPVGSRVWALLEQPRSIRDLCEQLLDEFDVDPPQCRAEVTAFVTQLLDAALVVGVAS